MSVLYRFYHFVFVLLASVLTAGAVLAEGNSAPEQTSGWLSLGARQDSLEWSIGLDAGPNIVSEQVWSDLQMAVICAGIQTIINQRVFVEASASFGSIHQGKHQDSDYALDNRGALWSVSENASDQGEVGDVSLVLGYQWFSGETADGLRLIPMIGGDFHYLDVRITDGRQLFSDQVNASQLDPTITVQPVGAIAGLDSNYKAAYWGGSLGLDLRSGRQFTVWLRGLRHYGWYYGEGDWNLRDTLAHPRSYSHQVSIKGYTVQAGARYLASDGWFWGMVLSDRQLQSQTGDHTAYLSNGSEPQINFNGGDWRSREFQLQIGSVF